MSRPAFRARRAAARQAFVRRSARLLPLMLALAGCQDLPTAASGSDPGFGATSEPVTTPAPATFDRPFFAGAFLGDAETQPERIQAAMDAFQGLVGKRPALVKTFHPMQADFSAQGWNGQLLRKIDAAGATNFVALDLRWPGAPRGALLDAINQGQADAHLTRIARELAAARFTVLLSPGWEMNGKWNDYHWQGVENGNEAGPAKYVTAWRRMVDIFRREGASNVRWVFSPNVGNALTHRASGSSHWNWYANYYPGDAYVDYLGPHGFNGSSLWGGSYQDFGSMFDGAGADHLLSDMERRYPGKPIIIGEYASEELPSQDKGRWIAGAFEVMRRHRNVVGAIWFQMNKETDWRINSSPSALAAYRAAMADPSVRSTFTR